MKELEPQYAGLLIGTSQLLPPGLAAVAAKPVGAHTEVTLVPSHSTVASVVVAVAEGASANAAATASAAARGAVDFTLIAVPFLVAVLGILTGGVDFAFRIA